MIYIVSSFNHRTKTHIIKRMKSIIRKIAITLVLLLSFMTVTLWAEEVHKAEDIKPPSGEKWYEEGDEKIYKFDIQATTPRFGIQDGIFIFYGHFIKPPYKVNAKYIKNEPEFKNKCEIYVNGLLVNYNEYEFQKKFYDYNLAKRIKNLKISEQRKNILRKINHLTSEFEKIQNILIKKYNLSPDSDQELAIEELKMRIDTIAKPVSYYINSIYYFKIEILKGGYITIRHPDVNDPLNPYVPPTPQQCQKESLYWMKHIRDLKSVWKLNTSKSVRIAEIREIAAILQSNISIEDKIMKIFQITENLDDAKFIYYNFAYKDFLFYWDGDVTHENN